MTAKALAAQLRYLRPALFALLVLDVLVIGAFAVRVQSVTRTTTTPAPVAAQPAPVPTTPVQPVPPAPAVPLGTGPAGDGTGLGTPVVDEPTPTPPVVTEEPAPDPGPDEPSARVARCPIPIKEPTTSGGLQTLIGYAPAFGPFRDEAFAAAAAYQPLLQLLGPILAKYPAIAPVIEPAMAPFISAFAGLLDQGYALLAPFYAPHRDDVLQAEAKLAAALAPYAQKLASSPLGGCVVELQAALVEDSA